VIERSLSQPASFAVIFDRHFDSVHAYLGRRIGSGRADDLASSTFVVAFERRSRFRRDATTARPWLLGIATNLLRDEWRAERRALDLLARFAATVLEATGDTAGDASPLAAALSDLDPDQRDVLLLYAWEELTYEEIADAVGVPVGTVRSRLARARSHLRSALSAVDELGQSHRR
jgi:RNA polymerase sigma-70 factor (ECF subfamily)